MMNSRPALRRLRAGRSERSNVAIGRRDLDAYTDDALVEWMNEHRHNRLRKDTAPVWVAVLRVFNETGPPMTVRQLFYALTTRGTVPKTKLGYRRVAYHVLEMRRAEVLPYSFVSDSTRWMRKPDTYTSLEAYFQHGKAAYRRALWANQADHVEIWLEKGALAGVFSEITGPWDVPLMVTRGYPSETFVFEAAEAIKATGKPAFVYAFYDYDPSGQNIVATTEAKLKGFGANVRFHVEAVQPSQIRALDLPTRPTKPTDARAKGWKGESVELDAIPADILRRMVEDLLNAHIDHDALEWTRKIELAERKTLAEVSKNLGLVRGFGQGVLHAT